jgi:hypothetical protein
MTLRPWKTINRYKELTETLTKTNALLKQCFTANEQIIEAQKGLIALRDKQITLKDEEITRLKADVKLLEATTVNTVDQVHRDGIEPPESKKYLN